MNYTKLKEAQAAFLASYPKGFDDEGLQDVIKRHNKAKLGDFTKQHFGPDCASNVEQTIANMVTCVSRSSMVSLFEKPKFRDFCARLDRSQKDFMVDSLCEFLHGNQQAGLEGLVDLLLTEKLAKWSLVTIIPAYYAPKKEVFVKPTTAKGVIAHFEIENLAYKPRPSWSFYKSYRSIINKARRQCDKSLGPSNAAFSGFLMMSI